ncbi:MAG: hypothetical protein Q8R36_01315 [bacterium]|nr:hypothetical protein [bacterium]
MKKEGSPKLAKIFAAALAAAPAADSYVPLESIESAIKPPAHITEAPGKGVDESYAESLLLEENDKRDWDSESMHLKKIEGIFSGLAKNERFAFAKRIGEEFPNTKNGELIAQVLLQKYKDWQKPGHGFEVVEKLAERSPFYFLLIANEVTDMPNAATLVRKTLSRLAVAVSYYEKYNKVPGAVDILIENTRRQDLTQYNQTDALLSSSLISEPDKNKIRESLPSRPRQLFLTLLSLQNLRAVHVTQNITNNPAFDAIDDSVFSTVAKHLKKSPAPFGDAEIAEWQKKLISRYYGNDFRKKRDEAKLAMILEVRDKYEVHPLQLMYRTAHIAQYLFDRNLPINEETIEKAFSVIEVKRNEEANKQMPKNAVILSHNEKQRGVSTMVPPYKLKAIEDRIKDAEGTFVHVSGDEPDPVELAKQAIVNAPAGMVLYVFAHGSPNGIFLRDGGEDLGSGNVVMKGESKYISPSVLAEAFANRYRNPGKKPQDDIILSHACYQSDYAEKFALEMAKRGVYIPLFAAPSEQGTTATGHPSTPLGTKIEESWIKARKRGDLFKQEFDPDTASHPSIFVPDTSTPFNEIKKKLPAKHIPAMMQISGISTYQGVAVG